MKLSRVCIVAMIVVTALTVPTVAGAQPSGLSNACWQAEKVSATVYGSGQNALAGEGDLWTCEKATTPIKVLPYDAAHAHQRCIGGMITVDPPSSITTDPLTVTIFIHVKRGVGRITPLGLCAAKRI
jgi:hypothetical protein